MAKVLWRKLIISEKKKLKYCSIIQEHTLNEYLLYLFSMMYGDVPKKNMTDR